MCLQAPPSSGPLGLPRDLWLILLGTDTASMLVAAVFVPLPLPAHLAVGLISLQVGGPQLGQPGRPAGCCLEGHPAGGERVRTCGGQPGSASSADPFTLGPLPTHVPRLLLTHSPSLPALPALPAWQLLLLEFPSPQQPPPPPLPVLTARMLHAGLPPPYPRPTYPVRCNPLHVVCKPLGRFLPDPHAEPPRVGAPDQVRDGRG